MDVNLMTGKCFNCGEVGHPARLYAPRKEPEGEVTWAREEELERVSERDTHPEAVHLGKVSGKEDLEADSAADTVTLRAVEKVTKDTASTVGNKGTRRQSAEDPSGLTRWRRKRKRRPLPEK